MTADLFTRLAARAAGVIPLAQPVLPAAFEPEPAQPIFEPQPVHGPQPETEARTLAAWEPAPGRASAGPSLHSAKVGQAQSSPDPTLSEPTTSSQAASQVTPAAPDGRLPATQKSVGPAAPVRPAQLWVNEPLAEPLTERRTISRQPDDGPHSTGDAAALQTVKAAGQEREAEVWASQTLTHPPAAPSRATVVRRVVPARPVETTREPLSASPSSQQAGSPEPASVLPQVSDSPLASVPPVASGSHVASGPLDADASLATLPVQVRRAGLPAQPATTERPATPWEDDLPAALPYSATSAEARRQLTRQQPLAAQAVVPEEPVSESSAGPISVTIGRIEVRVVQPPALGPARSAAPPAPALSLDDYLKQRNGDRQ